MVEQGLLPRFGAPDSQTGPGIKRKPPVSSITETQALPKQIEFKVAEVNRRKASERSIKSGAKTVSRNEASSWMGRHVGALSDVAGEVGGRIGARKASPDRAVPTAVKEDQSATLQLTPSGCAASAQDPKLRKEGGLSQRLFGSWFQSRKDPFKDETRVQPRSRNGRQPELSLDTVKVVRNDLGDSDFEILPLGSGAQRRDARTITPIPVERSTPSGGVGLATRLFNAVRVRV